MRCLQYILNWRDYRSMFSLLVALVLFQPIGAVRAQTVLGTASLYYAPVGPKSSAGSESPLIIPGGHVSSPVVDSAAKAQLRHLPPSSAGWRIEGEMGSLDWQVYMAAEDVAETKQFRFAYTASASVLPDVSKLTFRVNGIIVGQAGIVAPGELKPVEFDIPAHTLREGFNSISLSAQQRHRVDCTTEATYELWTQLDPARTGFITMAGRFAPKTTNLAALHPRADGTLVIRILFEGKMKPQRIDQTILAAQAIALAGKSERLLVSFLPDPDANFGINLVVGTAAEVANLLNSSGERTAISSPGIFLQAGREGRASTLIVTGADDGDVAKAVAQLMTTAKIDDANSTSSRIHAGKVDRLTILGGERIRLGDIERSNPEFSGRFFRFPIDVQMPADFLAADYGKLTFNLSGAYAAGLLSGAQLLVNLNGQDSASVPLSNPSGGIFHHNDIVVPLGALRPGRNVIEIAAKLPNGSDQVCDSEGTIDKAEKRFLLLGDSEIRFPRLARVGQMPKLEQTVAGGYPYSSPDSHPKLYVPTPDRESLSAAITLAVRLSVAAGHPIAFTLVLSNPKEASGNGLVVAAARSLDPDLMREVGMDPEAIRFGWEKLAPAPGNGSLETKTVSGSSGHMRSNDGALLSRITSVASSDGQVGRFPVEMGAIVSEGVEAAPIDAWAALLARRSFPDRSLDLALSVMRSMWNAASRAIYAVRDGIFGQISPSRVHIDSTVSLIVAQGYRNGASDVITIVTAPEATTLARSVEALMDPVRWSGLRGRFSAMNSSAQILETVEASHVRLIQTQPTSLSNSRLVIAGWLSLHPAAYVIWTLLMAAFLAFATNSLVKNVGRKNR